MRNDFVVISQDVAGVTALSDGRQVTAVINAATGASIARFFVEHATNSSNVILRVCGSDMGLTQASIGTPMTVNYFAYSWYFGGTWNRTWDRSRSRRSARNSRAAVPGDLLAYNQKGNLTFTQWALFPGTDPHAGLILINNSDFGAASRGGATAATEGLLLPR